MEKKNKYWMEIGEGANEHSTEKFKDEFPPGLVEEMQSGKGGLRRRDFLKAMGYSLLAAPVVSCSKMPFVKAVGFLTKDEHVIPGAAQYYATTCSACPAHCSIIAKTREGRPIKLEGNAAASIGKGGLCALGQSSLLPLYDSYRFAEPQENGAATNWDALDTKVMVALKGVEGKKIVILSKRISSPSSLAAVAEFKKKYSNVEHVVYEAYSESAFFEAQRIGYGFSGTTRFDLSDVNYILGVNADFLGTWQNPVEMTKQFSARRDPRSPKGMIKHAQIESYLSLSGSNADERIMVKPSQEESALYYMLSALLQKSGQAGLSAGTPPQKAKLDKVVAELWENKSHSLVVCGSNHVPSQVAANLINQLLGANGKSVFIEKNPYFVHENDERFEQFVAEMADGKVGAVLVWDTNPAYDYPNGKFADAFKKVPVRISLSSFPDETSTLCQYIAAASYALESWNDYAPQARTVQMAQPTVSPLRKTRSAQDSLLQWTANKTPYYEFMRSYWKTEFFAKQKSQAVFGAFWNKSVQDGFYVINGDVSFADNKIKPEALNVVKKASGEVSSAKDWELVLFQSIAMRDGTQANNAWLQELPDPITKLTWENAVQVAPADAKKLNIKDGDLVIVKVGSYEVKAPAIVQPGQPEGVLALSVGYGRTVSGKVGKATGVNAYPFVSLKNGNKQFYAGGAAITKVGGSVKLARTQIHSSMEDREIVKETAFGEFKKSHDKKEHAAHLVSLWQDHEYKGHAWGLAVDLSKCTGCSACVVGCHTENNVPVVGKEEVQNFRDMHWMRIDRYYTGDEAEPSTVHQPMLCHHCENAPCESVCPVIATVHSTEGLNQQVYNRCVGTRYCANNCPYKVRRFNWFDYDHGDELARMVLNPDVVVRSRGVMEKCSLCVQRIEEGKRKAKFEGRAVNDQDILPACQQSCPADAVVFGDLNNKKSQVRKLFEDSRNYALLEELNVRPRVTYLEKVRNRESNDGT